MGKFIKCWGMCVLLFVFWGGILGGGGGEGTVLDFSEPSSTAMAEALHVQYGV